MRYYSPCWANPSSKRSSDTELESGRARVGNQVPCCQWPLEPGAGVAVKGELGKQVALVSGRLNPQGSKKSEALV